MTKPELVLYPDVKHVSSTNNSEVTLQLFIPDDLAFLDGHFDKIAIVPGVSQIHWAVHFADQYIDKLINVDKLNCESKTDLYQKGLGNFYQMQVIKFKSLILPNSIIELDLSVTDECDKLYFRYFSQDHEYSSGRLYFKSE